MAKNRKAVRQRAYSFGIGFAVAGFLLGAAALLDGNPRRAWGYAIIGSASASMFPTFYQLDTWRRV